MNKRVGLVGRIVTFYYENYKGVFSKRRVRVHDFLYASTEWHEEPQFLMYAYDYDKMAFRYFAVRDITDLKVDM